MWLKVDPWFPKEREHLWHLVLMLLIKVSLNQYHLSLYSCTTYTNVSYDILYICYLYKYHLINITYNCIVTCKKNFTSTCVNSFKLGSPRSNMQNSLMTSLPTHHQVNAECWAVMMSSPSIHHQWHFINMSLMKVSFN